MLEYECYALTVLEGGRYDKLEKKPAAPRATAKPVAKPAPVRGK